MPKLKMRSGSRTTLLFSTISLLLLLAWSFRSHGSPLRPVRHQVHIQPDAGLHLGEREYRRAIQNEGTGERVRRFLEKAKSGKGFTVSVVGGSVSKGRGLTPYNATNPSRGPTRGAATLYSPENMHVMVFNWLDKMYPSPHNRFINGAQGGVGAGYFGWCHGEHIPDSDLIFVELGINDEVSTDTIQEYERLIRSLLELPSNPAVINIEVFTPLFRTLVTATALHTDILAYYDVPSVTIRDILLPLLLARPDEEIPRWYRQDASLTLDDSKVQQWGGVLVDLLHLSPLGHDLIADLIIAYFKRQGGTTSWWGKKKPKQASMHKALLTQPFDPFHTPAPFRPSCRSINAGLISRDEEAGGMVGIGRLGPFRGSHGWSEWNWQEKSYLVSSAPGSIIHFHFTIPDPRKHSGSDQSGAGGGADDADGDGEGGAEDDVDIEDDEQDEEQEGGYEEGVADEDTNAGANGAAGSRNRRRSKRRGRMIEGEDRRRRRRRGSFATRAKGAGRDVVDRRQQQQTPPGQHGHSVALAYLRSKKLGLGKVKCWVDNSDVMAVLDGYWDVPVRNMVVPGVVATNLSAGSHTLHCELVAQTSSSSSNNIASGSGPGSSSKGKSEFRIVAIMHD